MKKLTLYLVLSTCAVTLGFAQESRPSVMAWKLESAKRKAYFLAEMHNFEGDLFFKADHSLGESIVEIAKEIWVESHQESSDVQPVAVKLQDTINALTWNAVTDNVNLAVEQLAVGQSPAKQTEIANNFLNKLNGSTPLEAYISLRGLNFLLRRSTNSVNVFSHVGFRLNLEKKKSSHISKFKAIEDKDSIRTAWDENCGRSQSDALISNAERTIFEKSEPLQRVQDIFFAKNNDLTQISNALSQNEGARIFYQCIIAPRNKMWLSSLLKILDTPGEPLVLIFGVGHYVGGDGIFELLKKKDW